MVDKNLFGKDHWSTFAYLETRIVDHNGILNPEHMRVDIKIHPQFANRAARDQDRPAPPTRLSDGSMVENHDDWSCVDDLVEADLISSHGTGINPVYSLTEIGWKISLELRKHKAHGGNFMDFRYPEEGKL